MKYAGGRGRPRACGGCGPCGRAAGSGRGRSRSPHRRDQLLVGDQPVGVAHEVADDAPLDRREPDLGRSSASVPTNARWAARSSRKSVGHDHALARRLMSGRAAQRRSDAGDQLGHPERLGDVVVGAGVEREHLRAFVVAGGEHDDRHVRPAAQASITVMPSMPGRPRSSRTMSGCALGDLGSAASPVAASKTS